MGLCALCLSMVGCGGSTSERTTQTSDPAPRPALDLSFHWTNPSAELTTSDATFVRAFMESMQSIVLSGNSADGYPGFDRVNNGVWISQDDTPQNPQYRNVYMNILRIEHPYGSTAQAAVCLWMGSEGFHGFPTHLSYTQRGTSPPTDQAGPEKRPRADVFGDWRISRVDEDSNEDWETCGKLKPADIAPPDAAIAPVPGWPAAK
ncbi:hypothetical protein [Nocardia sp. CDC160]|uniref:hypothetical protein n=1 Tax=Nocardia sp. CDC160 TaxID=3112166 RepID=UPI002DBEBA17|nr:hypothetical protein [Nocardia sp. CDC160]MEC3915221.1 hypothetical protein [Nocardia sp. CDC160]